MSVKYCDYSAGDDTSGDGSSGNPYKTITKASTGLTGGDEVRVAKSPVATNLTGTLGFAAGSTTVTGVGTLFTTELTIGDFIKGGDGYWYEVITLTSNTAASLYKRYPGSTVSGVSSQKLGVTDTGSAAGSTTTVQAVSAGGSSSNKLTVSGGWDLSTLLQDGDTYFRQMNATFINRYGYGLYISGKQYVKIENLGFLRYNYGVRADGLHNELISVTCSGNFYGISLNADQQTLTSCICSSNAYYGFYPNSKSNFTFTSCVCNSNGNYGMYVRYLKNVLINSCTAIYNGSHGIYCYQSNHVIGTFCIVKNNAGYGIYSYNCTSIVFNDLDVSGSSTSIKVQAATLYAEFPQVTCQNYLLSANYNWAFYEYGTTNRDTTNARSTQCLKYYPSSSTYYISQSFYFTADSGVAQTLSAYIKDSSSFNGDVQVAIYFNGVNITGWATWTPTTSYVQQSITAAAVDITEDGVLELRIKVRGTAGNVFVDDLATA